MRPHVYSFRTKSSCRCVHPLDDPWTEYVRGIRNKATCSAEHSLQARRHTSVYKGLTLYPLMLLLFAFDLIESYYTLAITITSVQFS